MHRMSTQSRKPDLKLVQTPKFDPNQVPPHDEPRELALLGAILTNPRVIELVLDLVTPDDFYDKPRGVIFEAMLQVHKSGETVSRTSVTSWLIDRSLIAQVGGPMAIARLATEVPASGQAVEHARKIALKAKRRAFILDCYTAAAEGYGDVGDESEWLDRQTKRLRRHAEKLQPSNAISLRKSLEVFFQKLNRVVNNQSGVAGYSTGLQNLDKLTAGWHGGHITLVSGKTSAGKSAFAGCQALNVAKAPQLEVVELDGHRVDITVPIGVAIFTLEMEHDEQSQRLCCGLARVNWNLLQIGEVGPFDLQRLAGASDELSQLPIVIDDDHDLTMSRLEAKLARIEAMFAAMGVRLGLVVIDYFQLIDVRGEGDKNSTRAERFSEAGRRLKNFASRFKARPKALPIVNGQVVDAGYLEPSRVAFCVLVQLNKEGDVRECNALEMHAPNHWLIETPTEDPEGPGLTTIAKIVLKKQRGGKKNSVATCFRHDAYTLFTDEER
jgi:replicative DNA helicase